MKYFYAILLALCPAFLCIAQKNEMDKFEPDLKGYVSFIPSDSSAPLRIVFVTPENFVDAPVYVTPKTEILFRKKKKMNYDQLRVGMKISFTGLYFDKQSKYEAQKIVISEISDAGATLRDARLDYVSPEMVIIDGNRVKMGKGKRPLGRGKYEHKTTLQDFSELVEGDFAEAHGEYSDKIGVYEASKFYFEPRDVRKFAVDSFDVADHADISAVWFDASKRKQVFNRSIKGFGRILDDEKIQQYVQKLGESLVPRHVAQEIRYMFVVIDNPMSNAFVRPNGLAYVCAGLLKDVKNEAQLAGILSHEIAHAMYDHGKEEIEDGKRKQHLRDMLSWGKGRAKKIAANKAKKLASSKDKKGLVASEHIDQGINILFEEAPNAFFTARISKFNKEQELQADRVGLAIAASRNYDPIEIANFWSEQYDTYGKIPEGDQWFGRLKQAFDVNDANKPKTKATTEAMEASNTVVQVTRTGIYYLNSLKGENHPAYEKRFEELNRLIQMYWSDKKPSELIVGEEEYYENVGSRLSAAMKRTGSSKNAMDDKTPKKNQKPTKAKN